MSTTARRSTTATLSAAVGLCLALIFALAPIATRLAPGKSTAALLAHESIWWSFALIILLWLCFVEHLPFASIGFRRPGDKTFLYGILAGIALIATMLLHYAVIVPLFHLDATHSGVVRQGILENPLWYRVMLVVRAAVVEEILYRGYLIEKVRQLTGSTTLAAILSIAAFTYAHLSG